MRETAETINIDAGGLAGAEADGTGWMAGPYGVWEPRPGLTVGGLGLWGQSTNDVSPLGFYEDQFDTTRFMLSARIKGEIESGAWTLRPQATLQHYQETQDTYLDALEIEIPEQTVAIGRLRAGPEIIRVFEAGPDHEVSVVSGIDLVWDYNPAELIDERGFLYIVDRKKDMVVVSGFNDDVRADMKFGVEGRIGQRASCRVQIGFQGVGSGDLDATTVRAELRRAF